jgi:uncharacterized protein
MKPEIFLNNGRVHVWDQSFAMIRSRRTHPEAFANIIDDNEITVVMDETKVDEEDVIEIQKGWKLLTFEMVLPFELVGFLATVSTAIAEEGIPIFVVSAYSTDHLFVREKDLPKAKEKLKAFGCRID